MFGTGDEPPAAPRALSSERLEEEIVDLAARIAAATCRWLELIAEFEQRGAHEEWGFHCCASWLAWRCSIAARSAREHLRVARAIGELPVVREAMSRGELSYSKVRVLTRVATPEVESDLVQLARHATAAQLEQIAGGYRRAINAAEAERVYQRRYLSYEWEDDGSLSIKGSLAPEDGALLLRALEAGREQIREEVGRESPGGSAEPPRAREPVNADALVLIAETLLARGADVRAGGERTQIVVHVDEPVLAERDGDGRSRELPARCELEGGPAISSETARRLGCDSSRVTMIDGRDGPLDAGRRARTIPPATRRAIASRDRGCRFPGCTNRRWVDHHHIVHWADGGGTSPANLVSLCRRHHRLVHEGGFRVHRDRRGELRFQRPDGVPIESSPPLTRRRGAHSDRPDLRLRPARGAPVPLSAGERMDLHLTVGSLVDRRSARAVRGP